MNQCKYIGAQTFVKIDREWFSFWNHGISAKKMQFTKSTFYCVVWLNPVQSVSIFENIY